MNSRLKLLAACSLAISSVAACAGVERFAPGGSAGSAGESSGGSFAGDGDAAGGIAGGAAGQDETAVGGSGSSSAGTSAGSSATGGRAGTAGAGTAGAGTAGAGTAGSDTAGVGGEGGGTAGAGGAAAGGTASGGTGGVGAAGVGGAGGSSGSSGTQPLLKNGSFEPSGALAPWQIKVTPDVGKAIYTQWPNTAGISVDGRYEVSFWNGTAAFQGDLQQIITGLVPGKYTLKLYIAYGLGINAAYLYAINCGPSDVHVDLPVAESVSSFAPISIPLINVTGNSCTVGLFADMNTGNWLNADNFVFEALPTP